MAISISNSTIKLRAYPNNRVVMRPSENLSAYGGVRGQGGRPKMLEGVVFSTLRTFLADNAGIGLCSRPQ
ncbi:MAG: hypothetical protein ACYS30_04990 [Planctomycetota bacterium]